MTPEKHRVDFVPKEAKPNPEPASEGRCGKDFQTICNRPKGHKGMCGWETEPSFPSAEDLAKSDYIDLKDAAAHVYEAYSRSRDEGAAEIANVIRQLGQKVSRD